MIIMEPLKGGRLASKVPAEAMAALDAVTPGRSSAEWAFKWVYNFPEVTVILSGVSTMDQLKDNLHLPGCPPRHPDRGGEYRPAPAQGGL